jgi:hypothetical protein
MKSFFLKLFCKKKAKSKNEKEEEYNIEKKLCSKKEEKPKIKKEVKYKIRNQSDWDIYTSALSIDKSIVAFGVNG